ncbi:glycoside hydrolase family 28 protein [Lophiostoma macrostomum CBS 122681]|uniref:Glycoside hydrolase family 28 protein n=1 Tax=Lophiostoma macrostomum CBS 122681 TaxID=1314788 RepID=A0A6A6SY85_9PLEO|nr:glycoside hydrolase family 28 protein [Lophiostoma macrostomum CBS 122681]
MYDYSTSTARTKTCEVESGDPSGDDTAAILSAFASCKRDGHILFNNTTYYIQQAMNTTGLQNVDIELLGTLEWPANSSNIAYWLSHSLPIGFQNQSAAWLLGGDNVRFFGHGHGTLFGNGDEWYVYNNATSNLHGRPHAICFYSMTNSLISGLRFIKSQMWTSTVTRAENVELSDIYVNNSCSAATIAAVQSGCNVNTDGVDTIYANNITFLRWTVESGDDSISMKQNSTNIYMANNTFVKGLGYAMGSIGQYEGEFEVIQNITAVDTYCYDTSYAGRVKTWTGRRTGSPPNGGGAGLGYARNISFTNFTLSNVEIPWWITQCTSYNGVEGGCDTSLFRIEDMRWGATRGTTRGLTVASLQCSGAVNCTGIDIFANDLKVQRNGSRATEYLCSNVGKPVGFNCTGVPPPWSG